MTSEQQRAAVWLGWLRTGAGAAAWVAPGLTGRVLRIDAPPSSPVRYVLRHFGARDVAMGVAVLTARNERELDRWVLMGIAVDAADAASAVIGGVRGQVPRRTAVLTGLSALSAVAVGMRARQVTAGQN
jgi:hypothetical protein